MLDGIADASKLPTEVLNILQRPASFLKEPTQTMFDLVMCAVPGDDALVEKKNQNLSSRIVDHGVGV